MIQKLNSHINELDSMKKYPKELFYIGNIELLKKRKISFVGSRSANQYAKNITYQLANKLSDCGFCIVSGGALGIDTISHQAAGTNNTIMVAGTGLDIRYPAINKKLILDIETNGLVISQFKEKSPSTKYNFPLRNELIVALGEILIVTYADLNSGTMRSVEYALKMNKQIYVIPHRLGESDGTNKLLEENKAQVIYDIDSFISNLCPNYSENKLEKDDFLEYCKTNPFYDEAILKYEEKVLEYELSSKITIKNGKIFIQ